MKLPLAGLLALALAACQPSSPPAAHDAGPRAGMSVGSPWLRESPPGAPVVGGFLTLHNGTRIDDRLLSVESAAAERIEIHTMRDDDGVARMRCLADGLPLPAGATVELKPGGFHLMFIEPHAALEAGGRVDATLVFEHAGRVPVVFDVRPPGARAPAAHH